MENGWKTNRKTTDCGHIAAESSLDWQQDLIVAPARQWLRHADVLKDCLVTRFLTQIAKP
jgi:hypothetical protein